MFTKILLTTDGSPLAEEAGPVAMELARAGGGEIRIVSVVGLGIGYGVQSPEVGFYDTETFRKMRIEVEERAREAAQRIEEMVAAAGIKSTTAIRSGLPAKQILAEAREWQADVIVMSTHGRRGFIRALLGSCAAEVVHSATCPVLLHRRETHGDRTGTHG